jgi:nucleoside phosphorylase
LTGTLLILIISAFKLEILGILKKMKNKKIIRGRIPLLYEGFINGKKIILAVCGMGKENAILSSKLISSELLIEDNNKYISGKDIEKIIIAGVAAALKKNLSIGDVVLCNSVSVKKSGSDELEDKIEMPIPAINKGSDEKTNRNFKINTGALLTVNEVLTDANEKKSLNIKLGVDIADMESYWFLKNLRYCEKIIFCIRTISDNLDHNYSRGFQEMIKNERINYRGVIMFLLRHPLNLKKFVFSAVNFRKACRNLNYFIEDYL